MKPLFLTLISGLLIPIAARGGTTDIAVNEIQPQPETWSFRTAVYLWTLGLDGDMVVKGRSVPVDVGFKDILEDLDFSIMGAMEVGYGRWSLLADVNYTELSTSATLRDGSIDVGLDQFLGNFSLSYMAVQSESTLLSLCAGVRVNSMDTDVEIDSVLGDFRADEGVAWVDPVIGLRYQRNLSDRFFLRFVGDVGGFGVSSDFTWQAFGGLGWRVNEKGSMLVGFRGIGTDYTDGDFTYDVTSAGPVIGFEYRF